MTQGGDGFTLLHQLAAIQAIGIAGVAIFQTSGFLGVPDLGVRVGKTDGQGLIVSVLLVIELLGCNVDNRVIGGLCSEGQGGEGIQCLQIGVSEYNAAIGLHGGMVCGMFLYVHQSQSFVVIGDLDQAAVGGGICTGSVLCSDMDGNGLLIGGDLRDGGWSGEGGDGIQGANSFVSSSDRELLLRIVVLVEVADVDIGF